MKWVNFLVHKRNGDNAFEDAHYGTIKGNTSGSAPKEGVFWDLGKGAQKRCIWGCN